MGCELVAIMVATMILALNLAAGFNVVTENPIWLDFDSPDTRGSLFGYSAVLGSDAAYVGAPSFRNSGALFGCSFDGRQFAPRAAGSCSRIDPGLNEATRDWFGASVASDAAVKKVFVCAPRAITRSVFVNFLTNTGSCFLYQPDPRRMTRIFDLSDDLLDSGNGDWEHLTTMGDAMAVVGQDGRQVVVSAPLARTHNFVWKQEKMVGTVAKFDLVFNRLALPRLSVAPWGLHDRSSDRDPHRHDLTGTAVVRGRFFLKDGDHYAVGAPKANLYLGQVYLCPNCFDDDDVDDRLEARSSIFEAPVVFDAASLTLRGQQFGERFGQALCSVDLNGDGFDDLVIGAPLHAQSKGFYETGKIYVYRTVVEPHSTRMELVTSNPPRGSKLVSGARFGAALANLGRLDSDPFGDFAVGAPFEGDGAVYIYRGSKNFRFDEMPQRIGPADLAKATPVRGFGSSFSYRPADVDQNSRPDFIVGAAFGDTAVVLRSRPTVVFETASFFIAPLKAINPASNQFEVTVVAVIKEAIQVDLEATVTFNEVDERIDLEGGAESKVLVPRGTKEVKAVRKVVPKTANFGVDLSDPTHVPQPLNFDIGLRWELSQAGNRNCRNLLNCPLMDPRAAHQEKLSFSVNILSGCRESDRCRCDLGLSQEQRRGVAAILVGKDDQQIDLKLNVANRGEEPAFNAMLTLTSPIDLAIPRGLTCQNKTTRLNPAQKNHLGLEFVLECRLPAIPANQTVRIPFVTGIRSLSAESEDLPQNLAIELSLTSPCSPETQSPDTLVGLTVFDLTYEYSVASSPQTSPDAAAPSRSSQFGYNESAIAFEHVYRLENRGPSPVQSRLDFRILVPQDPIFAVDGITTTGNLCTGSPDRMSTNIHIPNAAKANSNSNYRSISCSTASGGCLVFQCHLPAGWPRSSPVHVAVRMTFHPEAKSASYQADSSRTMYDNYVVWTHLSVDDKSTSGGGGGGGHDDEAAATFTNAATEFFSVSTGSFERILASYWPIILGAAFVIVLYIVVVLVLIKTGAFKKLRFYKNRLDKSAQVVQRQSMMLEARRSMMMTMDPGPRSLD